MDFKLLLATFTTVFLAELGDKTQLATFAYSAGADAKRLTVFAGAALALILSTAIAVYAGGLIGRYVSPKALNLLAGAAFVAVGVWMLLRTGP